MNADTVGACVAAHAAGLIGTPFRLHGRDPAHGLDCIGLAQVALHRAGLPVSAPAGYRLRNTAIDSFLSGVAGPWLEPVRGAVRTGDLVLVQPGPAQHHLVIIGPDNSFIHAHAGLGRVVRTPGQPFWPVCSQWRPQTKV